MAGCPDDEHAARLLIRQLREAGLEITYPVTNSAVFLHATCVDGQVSQHTRDDGDLLAAVCEIADWFGYDLD